MKSIYDVIEGNHAVNEDTNLYGVISGDVIVKQGYKFNVYGIVSGNIMLERDSSLNLYGIVSGDVIDHGAAIIKKGILNGNIQKAK